MKIYISKSSFWIFLILGVFLFTKGDPFQIRISDTNIYFLTGLKIFEGHILYKDIFFTNFPLFPYISIFYGLLTGWNISYFFATALFEIGIISLLIYKISFVHSKNVFFSLLSVVIYLFSFLVLATSDHQTGVFTANVLSLLGYYIFLKNKFSFSGILLACAVLTKVYFLPIPAALILYVLFKNRSDAIRLLCGFLITIILILSFFFIQSKGAIFQNIFLYSLQRTQGVSKLSLIQFFILKDFVLCLLLLINLSKIKNKNYFGFLSLFSILFLILYKDVYYLYLNFLAPFLSISLVFLLPIIHKNRDIKLLFYSLISFSILISISTYVASYKGLQKISNPESIVQIIQNENPSYLYGINTITPTLSYLSGVPLLNGIIDTNENRFLTGNLHANELTQDAIEKNALIVTKSAVYPEYGIDEKYLSAIFDKKQLGDCRQIYSQPVQFEGPENALSIVSCRKN